MESHAIFFYFRFLFFCNKPMYYFAHITAYG